MVSLLPAARPYEPAATTPKPRKPLLRRPTLSGTIRKSEDANLSDDLLITPTKRARVTFNPTVQEKVMEEYSVKGRSVEVIRNEVTRAIELHKRGDSADYDALKEVFAPREAAVAAGSPSDDEEEDEEAAALAKVELKTYLIVLTNHVSLLKGCSGLVRAVLACEWLGRDTGFVKVYIHFLGHLVSAQGGYVGVVLDMLAAFFHSVKLVSGRLPGYPDVNRAQLTSRVHAALKHILGVIPSAGATLSQIISTRFPFNDESKTVHMKFINNLIQLLKYAPHLKSDIFALITERLVKIDVQMQVDLDDLDDEVAAAIVQAISLNAPTPTEDDAEADVSDAESVISDDSINEDTMRIKVVQDNVEKMDAILDLLFTTYNPHFLDPHSREATEMFETLLAHFQKIILPTYRSRHTQFLLFHFAQTADYLVDQFAGTCAQLAFDSTRPAVLRQSSAAYLASFVARGVHVQAHVVRTVFDLIGSKLDAIRSENEVTCRGPDLRRYGTFYAMTQALLYIFCFRWRDLIIPSDAFDEDDATTFRGQDLQWIPGIKETLFRTIHSKLNPLKICSPPIVLEFAKIAKHLEFMQVYPLLETNKRIRLSQFSSAQGSSASIRDSGAAGVSDESWHQLDAYFPFDPYQLPVSKRWIEGDYVQWKGIPGLNRDEDSEDDEEEEEDGDVDADSEDTATDNDDDDE